MLRRPKISVVTTNKNGGRFLRETIESVMMQKFTDYEHIIIDSASTDDSLEIIKSYPHIRWISEPDNSASEGFQKGFKLACGDYIMVMSVSDIYLSRTWFRRCVEVLDADLEISLVWGLAVSMNDDGDINDVWQPWWLDMQPPQKKSFLGLWFASNAFAYLPELNYCVRRKVFLECYFNSEYNSNWKMHDTFLVMLFNFHTKGYLPYFLPIIAHCGRVHEGQISEVMRESLIQTTRFFRKLSVKYCLAVLSGRKSHYFRNGQSKIIGQISIIERLKLPIDIVKNLIYIIFNRIFRLRIITIMMRRVRRK